jgi:hypothetical protein
MKKRMIIGLTLAGIILYSCSKTSEDVIADNNNNGGGDCDTVNIKYQADIVPILSSTCYTCHGTNSNSGSNGIILEGYENLKAKAETGTLLGVITHAPGYPPMPDGGAKLSECNINKFRSWINNGMQNN